MAMACHSSCCGNGTTEMLEAERRSTRCRTRIQELLSDESAFRQCKDQLTLENFSQPYQLLLWRDRVAQWFFDVVDHLNIPREIVFLAMNFLDRSVAVDGTRSAVKKEDYELKSTTCLFLAIRVSCKAELKISELLLLIESRLQVKDVQAAGSRLLQVLSMKTPMITPMVFAKAYLALIQSSISSEDPLSLLETTYYVMQLSLCDHSFSGVTPSKLAFAAVAACIGNEHATPSLEPKTRQAALNSLQEVTSLAPDSTEIKPIFQRLLAVHSMSHESVSLDAPNVILDDSNDATDPCRPLDSTGSLISLLPWTPTVSNLLSFPQERSCKRARLH